MRKNFLGLLGLVLVLATNTCAQTTTPQAAQWSVLQLQFSGDGEKLLATLYEHVDDAREAQRRKIVCWDIAGGQQLSQSVLPASRFALFSRLLFSPDGVLCVRSGERFSFGLDATIFHTATGEAVCQLEKREGETVYPFAFSPDGKLLVGADRALGNCSEDCYLPGKPLFWDTCSGKQVRLFDEFEEEEEQLYFARFSSDNRRLALVLRQSGALPRHQQRCVIIDRFTGRKLSEFWFEEELAQVALSSDGKQLATLSAATPTTPRSRTIRLRDSQTGTVHKTFSFFQQTRSDSFLLAFTEEDYRLTVFGTPQQNFTPAYELHTWRIDTGELLRSFSYLDNEDDDTLPHYTAFSPQAQLQGIATGKGHVELRVMGEGKVVRELEVEDR